MPVGMLSVRLLAGNPDACNYYKGAEYIGCGVHGVGNHRAGFRQNTREQLQNRKRQVDGNTDNGYPHGDSCGVLSGLLLLILFVHSFIS